MQEQSFQAKLVKECIRLAAGNRLIGPKIKMGELQRHLVDKEPLWRKPEDVLWERKSLQIAWLRWCSLRFPANMHCSNCTAGICESTAQYLSKFCL